MIGRGVPRGVIIPFQAAVSSPAIPLSCIVGTPGSIGLRVAVVRTSLYNSFGNKPDMSQVAIWPTQKRIGQSPRLLAVYTLDEALHPGPPRSAAPQSLIEGVLTPPRPRAGGPPRR